MVCCGEVAVGGKDDFTAKGGVAELSAGLATFLRRIGSTECCGCRRFVEVLNKHKSRAATPACTQSPYGILHKPLSAQLGYPT